MENPIFAIVNDHSTPVSMIPLPQLQSAWHYRRHQRLGRHSGWSPSQVVPPVEWPPSHLLPQATGPPSQLVTSANWSPQSTGHLSQLVPTVKWPPSQLVPQTTGPLVNWSPIINIIITTTIIIIILIIVIIIVITSGDFWAPSSLAGSSSTLSYGRYLFSVLSYGTLPFLFTFFTFSTFLTDDDSFD